MKKTCWNIGVITPPISEAGNVPLSNLIDILCSFYSDIYVITGNKGNILHNKCDKSIHLFKIRQKIGANLFTKVTNYIYAQLRISFKLIKLTRNIDLWIFFMGADFLLLPMLTAKLLRKHVVMALPGSALKAAQDQKDPFVFVKVIDLMGKINRSFSDKIVVYSGSLVEEWNLEKYKNKISIAHKHFLDFDKFKIKKKFDERDNLVGYIGRLSEEKGAMNFVKAIPEVLKERNEIKFLMGGDGTLRDEIGRYLNEENLSDKVKFAGWIPHDKLSKYLNELKLLVLPSYTEGLPNVMLEAMACGTPVLATPVGAIPDVIKDKETGFIMKDNSPECIAENVERALEYPNLDKTVKNAKELVEKEFTYEAAVERYREILEGL